MTPVTLPADDPRGAMAIDALELNARIVYALRGHEVYRVSTLVQLDDADVLKILNIGRLSLAEIKRALSAHGLTLGMQVENAETAMHMTTADEIIRELDRACELWHEGERGQAEARQRIQRVRERMRIIFDMAEANDPVGMRKIIAQIHAFACEERERREQREERTS